VTVVSRKQFYKHTTQQLIRNQRGNAGIDVFATVSDEASLIVVTNYKCDSRLPARILIRNMKNKHG
jgi:hypothetical protein